MRLTYLSPPTKPVSTPTFHLRVLCFGFSDDLQKLWHVHTEVSPLLPPVFDEVLLLFRVWRIDVHWKRFTIEEVRHQDQGVHRGCHAVSPLQCLGYISEYVVDGYEGAFGSGGARDVWIVIISLKCRPIVRLDDIDSLHTDVDTRQLNVGASRLVILCNYRR